MGIVVTIAANRQIRNPSTAAVYPDRLPVTNQ
jgi:hypothetical protein